MNEHTTIKVERGGWRRHVAVAGLAALGIAAGASSAQLVSAAPAPEAPAPELLAQLTAEAGSAWAGRVAIADQYSEIRADEAQQARLARLNKEAGGAWAARVAVADDYAELRADAARQAGSDRHLENSAQRAGGRITVR